MQIERLSLTHFRSYRDAVIHPARGANVLVGENGAGKTNVLEAISLLVPGRGLRGAALGDMAQSNGPGGFGVAARITGPQGPVDLGCGTTADAPERRLVRINGAQATQNALSEWLTLIWLTPAMDRLFTEPASGRRRFLDRLVQALIPAHAHHAARYEAAMRQRNRILADERPADPAWLMALESQMAEHGTMLDHARRETLNLLGQKLAVVDHGPFARPVLALEGWVGLDQAAFTQELARGRARDAAAGRTLSGPHRCDLNVTHYAKQQPADRCSTGEQKALLLALILAHAELVREQRGEPPILLLDEVAAHLDPLRRAALFARLAASGSQYWMTGTDLSLFAGDDAMRFYLVKDHAITQG